MTLDKKVEWPLSESLHYLERECASFFRPIFAPDFKNKTKNPTFTVINCKMARFYCSKIMCSGVEAPPIHSQGWEEWVWKDWGKGWNPPWWELKSIAASFLVTWTAVIGLQWSGCQSEERAIPSPFPAAQRRKARWAHWLHPLDSV